MSDSEHSSRAITPKEAATVILGQHAGDPIPWLHNVQLSVRADNLKSALPSLAEFAADLAQLNEITSHE